jgi:hypothetical protein
MVEEKTIQLTGYFDKKGIPIAVGDLVRIFLTAHHRRRKIYMHKKVMTINNRFYLVDFQELGEIPTAECHKCLIADAGKNIEILDGRCCDHPLDKTLVCWWERKQLPDSMVFGD